MTLRNVSPPVWRRVEVRSTTKLAQLAAELEGAMGWLGGHLHAFDTPTARYGRADSDWASDELDEHRYRVVDALPGSGSKMRWSYDFGDGWEHDVVVEAIEPVERGVHYPRCTDGRRACPPEDCGGPWGYQKLLGTQRLLDRLSEPTGIEDVEFAVPASGEVPSPATFE